jgi:hypothetical protein
MAYTWVITDPAFNIVEGVTPEGFDYQNANELLTRIMDSSQGRLYIDESGNLTYESRYHRDV